MRTRARQRDEVSHRTLGATAGDVHGVAVRRLIEHRRADRHVTRAADQQLLHVSTRAGSMKRALTQAKSP